MSLERTDRGPTVETTNGDEPKDSSPPKDTPGAPGYPSRRESLAVASAEASPEQAKSEQTGEQKSPSNSESAEPKRDDQPGRDEREDRESDSSKAGDPTNGERSAQSSTGPGESLTPRLDSRRASAVEFEQPTDSGADKTSGTRSPPDGRTDEPRQESERDQQQSQDTMGTVPVPERVEAGRDQRPTETPDLDGPEAPPANDTNPPIHGPREPDAHEQKPETTETQGEITRLRETSDGAPRLGTERQNAGDLPASPREADPALEETRGTDGSWKSPQERAEIADDGRPPLVPEHQYDGEEARNTERPTEPAADTGRGGQNEIPEVERPEAAEHGQDADEPPQDPTDQSAPANDGAEPDHNRPESSTELAEPDEPQEPVPSEESRFAGARAYVGLDGEVKWLLMEDLELQGPGYEGPRTGGRDETQRNIEDGTDLRENPEKRNRWGDFARVFNNDSQPDDVVKHGNSLTPKLESSFSHKPPEGTPSTAKETRSQIDAPQTQVQYGSVGFGVTALTLLGIYGARRAAGAWKKWIGRNDDSGR